MSHNRDGNLYVEVDLDPNASSESLLKKSKNKRKKVARAISNNVIKPINEHVVQPVNEHMVQPVNQKVVQPINEKMVQPAIRKVGESVDQVSDSVNDKYKTLSRNSSRLFKEKVSGPVTSTTEKINEVVSDYVEIAKSLLEPVLNGSVDFVLEIQNDMKALKSQYKREMLELENSKASSCFFTFHIDFEIETKRQKKQALEELLKFTEIDKMSLEDLSRTSERYMSDVRVSWSLKTSNMMNLLTKIKNGCDNYLEKSNEYRR